REHTALGLGSAPRAQQVQELPAEPVHVSLSCTRARAIVAEARTRLAVPVKRIEDELFADLAIGWLDPHGLWSAASDAPTGALLRERARSLREELEGRTAPDTPRALQLDGPCDVAASLGRALEAWVSELRPLFDHARSSAPALSREQAYALATG